MDGRPTQAQHYSAPVVLTSKPGAGTPDGRPAADRWNRVRYDTGRWGRCGRCWGAGVSGVADQRARMHDGGFGGKRRSVGLLYSRAGSTWNRGRGYSCVCSVYLGCPLDFPRLRVSRRLLTRGASIDWAWASDAQPGEAGRGAGFGGRSRQPRRCRPSRGFRSLSQEVYSWHGMSGDALCSS